MCFPVIGLGHSHTPTELARASSAMTESCRRLHADTYPADKDAKSQQPGELLKVGSRDPGGGSMMLVADE